jgi:putative transposase
MFTDSEILAVLKQAGSAAAFSELCREHAIKPATFCRSRSKCGGM